jgi:hypothetical protein
MIAAFTTIILSASNASAEASINGPAAGVPISDIEIVLIEPEVTYPFIHHFMCIYIWDGEKWVVGTAGEVKDAEEELQKCIDQLGENTAAPDYTLDPQEYIDFEHAYTEELLDNGVGNILCEALGMLTCPFTCGYGKPCYRETKIIEGILDDIIAH